MFSASSRGRARGAKMVVVRRRNVKMFTFAFLLITVTSFLLNYTHQVTTTTWDPRHLVVQFSEHVQKLFKYPRRPCSCRTCISELGHSLWFDQRFNSTMQPFLTSQNALIPEDSYRWWLVSGGVGTAWTLGGRGGVRLPGMPSTWKEMFSAQSICCLSWQGRGRKCLCCCLSRRGLECMFTCSKLENSLTELGVESRICQYCHFLPSPPKTKLCNPSVSASDGLFAIHWGRKSS